MMKAKRKHKRKAKLNPKNWVLDLFRPIVVNFIVQLPPEECAARLRNPQKYCSWRLPKTCAAVVTPMDDASYTFHIKQENEENSDGILRTSFIKAEGYLWQRRENTTYIESEIGIYYGPVSVDRIIGLLIITILQIIFCFLAIGFTPKTLLGILIGIAVMLTFYAIMLFFMRLFSRCYVVKMLKTILSHQAR